MLRELAVLIGRATMGILIEEKQMAAKFFNTFFLISDMSVK